MEYILLILVLAAFVLCIFFMETFRAKKAEKEFLQRLYEDGGAELKRDDSPERFAKVGSYFSRHPAEGQLDDITWNDLGMDELFQRMNYTFSASGEEYLYYTLRTPKEEAALQHLEEVVAFLGEHPEERVKIQFLMHRLGHTGKFSLYDYLDYLECLGQRSNRRHLFADALFLPLIGLLWVNFSVAILGIVVVMVFNIVGYFKEKGEIDPYITSFAYILRLLEISEELEKCKIPVCRTEWEQMAVYQKNLQTIRRNSFWVLDPQRGRASGNVLEIFLDYVRMVFHLDLIKFNAMLKKLRGHLADVDGLVSIIGYMETAVAVWIFRNSLTEGYCVPQFCEKNSLSMEQGYHPLLKNPVKNSICAEKGVLLTGSNASGKSTFLKTVAVNAVLAQTIHTCTAEKWTGAFFHIYSSMALRDNLGTGESYYIVEIKALKRILDAQTSGAGYVLCFVDEVLRGTNTVERIAASTQILKSLGKSGVLCFAATHDIELTELLQKEYDNYHFSEEIREGDVVFDYKLQKGKATTRNAIRLLELMGYHQEIIDRAAGQAENFLRTGVWRVD